MQIIHNNNINLVTITAGLAIDYRVGLHQDLRRGRPISKLRPVLDSSSQTTWVMYFGFFEKSKIELVLANFDVFGDFSEDSIVLRWQRHISESTYYEHKTNLCLQPLELFKKSCIRTSYHTCKYLVLYQDRPRSIFEQKHSFLKN